MPKESAIKGRIVAELRRRGYWATRIAASPYQRAGLPDILVALRSPRGHPLWIEAKQPGERPTRLQLATHDELRAAGMVVVVATSVDEAVIGVEDYEHKYNRGQLC